jgi:hypothetical protein
MKQPYLEVTFRKGKPLAAYLYLPRQTGDRAVHSELADAVMVVDRAADNRPIGIELIDPAAVTMEHLNNLLRELDQPTVQQSDLTPLYAA